MIIPSKIKFPDPSNSDEDGLLAYGGNLLPSTLLEAYANGIFPWFNDDDSPILWWSPDPRMVLFPGKLKISNSLKQVLGKDSFKVSFDKDFEKVISLCSSVKRKGEAGTWITGDMKKAYLELHEQGFAHSVEVHHNSELVGGLYGVSLGGAFFGESMFHKKPNASKIALVYLVNQLKNWNFDFIDAQLPTKHLESMGGEEISRKEFLVLLKKSINKETIIGKWDLSLIA
ncbi:MAG: leucyl/phenylalanyl-tRNA--protein transferase [Bacteroidota bacterium]